MAIFGYAFSNAGIMAEFTIDNAFAPADFTVYTIENATSFAVLTGLDAIMTPDIRTYAISCTMTAFIAMTIAPIIAKVGIAWTDNACTFTFTADDFFIFNDRIFHFITLAVIAKVIRG